MKPMTPAPTPGSHGVDLDSITLQSGVELEYDVRRGWRVGRVPERAQNRFTSFHAADALVDERSALLDEISKLRRAVVVLSLAVILWVAAGALALFTSLR